MKKKTIIIVVTCALLLALLVGGTVFAAHYEPGDVSGAQTEPSERIEPDFSNAKKDTTAEAKRTVALSDEAYIDVKYSRSKDMSDGKEVDVYRDADGKEYLFEKDGTYIGLLSTPKDQTDESKYEVLTEDDICKIAKDYAVAMFGADIEKYTLTNVFYQELYDRYFITFAKKYGKDGFATGEVCKAVVGSDGTVQSCTTPNSSALEGFDPVLLDGITLDDVKEFADKQAADIFDSLISSELTGVSIVNKDGKYMLRITYHHTAEQLDADTIDKYDIGLYQSPGNPQFNMSYYYPLEP